MELERTRPARQARLSGALQVFDLGAAAARLREEPAYATSGRNGITLAKDRDLRVVLEVLRAGSALHEHRAPGPITVQILEGEIRFQAEEEIVYLGAGELLSLGAGIRHAVEAVRDSAFLLTVAPTGQMEPHA